MSDLGKVKEIPYHSAPLIICEEMATMKDEDKVWEQGALPILVTGPPFVDDGRQENDDTVLRQRRSMPRRASTEEVEVSHLKPSTTTTTTTTIVDEFKNWVWSNPVSKRIDKNRRLKEVYRQFESGIPTTVEQTERLRASPIVATKSSSSKAYPAKWVMFVQNQLGPYLSEKWNESASFETYPSDVTVLGATLHEWYLYSAYRLMAALIVAVVCFVVFTFVRFSMASLSERRERVLSEERRALFTEYRWLSQDRTSELDLFCETISDRHVQCEDRRGAHMDDDDGAVGCSLVSNLTGVCCEDGTTLPVSVWITRARLQTGDRCLCTDDLNDTEGRVLFAFCPEERGANGAVLFEGTSLEIVKQSGKRKLVEEEKDASGDGAFEVYETVHVNIDSISHVQIAAVDPFIISQEAPLRIHTRVTRSNSRGRIERLLLIGENEKASSSKNNDEMISSFIAEIKGDEAVCAQWCFNRRRRLLRRRRRQ